MSERIKSLSEILIELLDKSAYETRVSVPGSIVNYDATSQTASVKILVKEKDWNGSTEGELVIPDVLVVLPASSETCYLSLPVLSGTLGELTFADRSLSNYINSEGTQSVSIDDDFRSHDMSFCYFTPGLRPIPKALSGKDADSLHLRNGDIDLKLVNTGDGKISVENDNHDLIEAIGELAAALNSALVITGIGPQPFNTVTADAIAAAKAKIDTFIV